MATAAQALPTTLNMALAPSTSFPQLEHGYRPSTLPLARPLEHDSHPSTPSPQLKHHPLNITLTLAQPPLLNLSICLWIAPQSPPFNLNMSLNPFPQLHMTLAPQLEDILYDSCPSTPSPQLEIECRPRTPSHYLEHDLLPPGVDPEGGRLVASNL